MKLSVAEAYFEVRALLDWRLLEKAGIVELDEFVITEASDLARLFFPWHQVEGRSAGWDWRGARPFTPPELFDNPGFVTADRYESILQLEASFRAHRNYLNRPPVPVQFTILAYGLGDAGHVIVDGNQRIAGLYRLARSGWRFQVLVACIKGPIDGLYLPDLYQHQPGGVPEELLKDPEVGLAGRSGDVSGNDLCRLLADG
jgi:hypothetical protein